MTIYQQIAFNKRRSVILLLVFILITTFFFYLLGQYFNQSNYYLVLGVIFSLFSTITSYFYSDKIILFSVGAVPANKKDHFNFYTVTENLTIAAGLPMPKLYVIDDPSPNAFATGRDPNHSVVCVTTGLLSLLNRSELEGVIAHELSHIKNYDVLLATLAAVLVGAISLISDWFLRRLWWSNEEKKEGNAITQLLIIISLLIMPLTATLIQLAVSRRREFLADANGALITRFPQGLAKALEKIAAFNQPLKRANPAVAHLFFANPFNEKNKGQWFLNLFNTHPPIEERIRLLRQM